MLKKKRNREGGYQRKKFIGITLFNIGINNPYEHLYGKRFEDPKESMKGEECKKLNYIKGIEKRSFYVLNEIVESFKENFRNEGFSDSQILNALILNSMNMKKAYNFLKNPQKVNKSIVIFDLRNYFQSG